MLTPFNKCILFALSVICPQILKDMAAKTITMEQLKLILRLRQNGISVKEIARQTGLARNIYPMLHSKTR
jgi:hypothetical protein